MLSFRANLIRLGFRSFNIFSSISKKSYIENVRKISEKAMIEQIPEGFIMERLTTPNGTKFERMFKKDAPKNGRAVLFFHGGGYIVGLLYFYRLLAPDVYEASGGAEMIFLDYKCAPEYKYPTQLNEAEDLWNHLTENMGYKPENIMLGGDSAGANLMLSLMLKMRDSGKNLPFSAFCISPWTDMTGSGKSLVSNYGKDVLFGRPGKKLIEEARLKSLDGELYSFVGNADRFDSYVSPVYGEYHDYVPMMFTVGGDEMLLDDTLRIVEKLKSANIPVVCEIQPKMFHVYTLFGKTIPESKISFERLMDFIHEQFANINGDALNAPILNGQNDNIIS